MILTGEIAANAFKKAEQIREEYRRTVLKGDANVISIEDLQWVIEQMYQVKIEKRLVNFKATFIRGMVERWPGVLKIFVRQEQTLEDIRFTATKEMCHGIIDEPEDWSTDGVATLEDLLQEWTLVKEEEAARATQSEVLAELVAIELLYPFELRVTDRQKLDLGTTTIAKIATYHRLPDHIVSKALSRPHHRLAEAVWGLLNPARAAE